MTDRAIERVLALIEAGPDASQERRREIEAELHHDSILSCMTDAPDTLPVVRRGAAIGGGRKRPTHEGMSE